MNADMESGKHQSSVLRSIGQVGVAVLLAVLLVTSSPNRILPDLIGKAKAAHSLTVSYLLEGGLRADLLHIRDCAEYLFCPGSDIGTRLEFDLEDWD